MITCAEEATPPAETQEEEDTTAPKVPKKGLKLSYEEYKQMANLMVLFMRKSEEEAEGRISSNIPVLTDLLCSCK